eukprot:289465-Chlamydomonas_euryale.AAC.1
MPLINAGTLLTSSSIPHCPPLAHSAQELDSAIKTALECPCVSGIRDGPCGPFFVAAFTCYHKSKDIIKGAECFHVNVAFAVSGQASGWAWHR